MSDLLTRRSDIVEAGGSYEAIDTSGTLIGSGTSWEGLTVCNTNRVRQNGTVKKVQFYCHDKTGLTSLKVRIWRKLGLNLNWHLIGETEDLLSKLTGSQVNTVTLSSPISNVREGDYISIQAVGAVPSFAKYVAKTEAVLYRSVSSIPTVPYNWEAQSSTASAAIPVKAYMQAPHAVHIGDSYAAGGSTHKSFADTLTGLPYSADHREGTMPFALSHFISDYVYQNMGQGGQNSTQCLARFDADCVNLKPRYAIICITANDTTDAATSLANVDAMIAKCVSAAIEIYWLLLPPHLGLTNTEMQAWDYLNAQITSRVEAAAGTVINSQQVLGQFRTGGDAGNYWDTKAEYTSGDLIHPSPAGYWAWAEAVLQALLRVTKLKICNSAILSLGGNVITSFSDLTTEAKLSSAFWAPAVDAVLRLHPWNCAIKRATLTPDASPPAYEWTAAFSLPSDLLRILDLDGVTEYKTEGGKILCNEATLNIRYVYRNEATAGWDALLTAAMAAYMAFLLSYPLTKSNTTKDGQWKLFTELLRTAKNIDAQEEPGETIGDFPFLNVRG